MKLEREYRLTIQDDVAVPRAAIMAREYARACGFSMRGQWRVAIVAAELSSNVSRHAGKGVLVLRPLGRDSEVRGLAVCTYDRGTFAGDPQEILADGYSQRRMPLVQGRPGSPRSLGAGLEAVKRMSNRLIINKTSAGGTVIVAVIYRATYNIKGKQSSN